MATRHRWATILLLLLLLLIIIITIHLLTTVTPHSPIIPMVMVPRGMRMITVEVHNTPVDLAMPDHDTPRGFGIRRPGVSMLPLETEEA